MKKILIIIIVAVITVVAVFTGKYIELSKQKSEVKKINNEFLAYQKSIVKINRIVTVMNRAIDINNKNNIEKDENGVLRCNFDNEKFEIDVSFAKAIIDYIDNDRIKEMFDSDSNTERYLFYKLGNKLYYDYVSIEDTDIDDLEDVLYDELDWSYPFDIEPTDYECQKFKEALEYYISSKQKRIYKFLKKSLKK